LNFRQAADTDDLGAVLAGLVNLRPQYRRIKDLAVQAVEVPYAITDDAGVGEHPMRLA
jgi:hypothetical protein